MSMRGRHPGYTLHRRAFLEQVGGLASLVACWPSRLSAQPPQPGEAGAGELTHAAVRRRLKGPMASITIPYRADYSVDHESLAGWVEFACANKTPVLFLTFGDSELDFLAEEEIEAVIRTVARRAAGRALVVGGTGAWWTGRLENFLKRIADSGVDAINVHLSSRVTQETEIHQTFQRLSDSTPLPLLTYDRNWSVDLIQRIAALPNVIGDKCHYELYRFYDYVRTTRDRHFCVLGAGQMRQFFFGYQIGSPAYLCPLAPFAPQVSLAFYDALVKQQFDRAKQIMREYEDPLLDTTIPLGYPQVFKSLLYLTGHHRTNLVRPPKISNGPEELDKLRGLLARLELPAPGP